MRIRVLGCSGGIGPGLRTTSLLLDDDVLIDAGTGVGELDLAEQSRIRRVFLTHSHLDHVCGLAFMADNLFDRIEAPISVHASDETLQVLRQHIFNWSVWPDFSVLPDEQSPLLKWRPLVAEESIDIGESRTLTAFRVLHTVPALGYAISSPRGCFAFSGDTYADDGLWRFLNRLPRLDQLMIELAFPNAEAALGHASKHFTPDLLGAELRKLDHHPRLYLTHAKPGFERVIERECRTALRGWDYVHLKRGDTIRIG